MRRAELAEFQGSIAVPGDFQLPMLLLALLVGEPLVAAKLFPQFLGHARDGHADWWAVDWSSISEMAGAERIQRQVSEIAGVSSFPRSPAGVTRWLPEVARYSFATANIFVEEH
ncbi:MAG: hypothetical protein AAAB20_18785 [Rhizobium sp.]|uniref:hypothetical protein n=1 Tax=Rhizobium sp. TaxID=391 RepID=UPI0012E0478A